MARPKRIGCKVSGCPNPRHVYPSGVEASYCDDHLYLRKATRKGLANMTGAMRQVLTLLDDAHEADVGHVFVALNVPKEVDRRTLRALVERDWIIISPGIDGDRYKITSRGAKTLRAYKKKWQRRDGICPRCGKRPRHVRSSGTKDSYCLECLRAISKRKRDLGIQYINTDRLCSRCHKHPLHQYPGGKFSTYCEHCARVNRRKNARKQRRRLFRAIQNGAPVPMCKLCKVRPCVVSANTVSEVCYECRRTQGAKHRRRKALGLIGFRP